MRAKELYNEFLKREKEGNYIEAWEKLMLAMYSSNFKSYKDVVNQIYTVGWYTQRQNYLDVNNKDWQLTIACIFEDADRREDGIICYLAFRILEQNYRWYNACSSIACMETIIDKYFNWEEFKKAMEIKAKKLGFDVHNEYDTIMYCNKCGEKIVVGSKFCHVCGTKLDIDNGFNIKVNISEKRNRMVHIEGKGLYYVAKGSQICFAESGQTKIKKLTKYNENVLIDGLGYYNDELFYWYQLTGEGYENSELRAINVHTLEKRKVKKFAGWDLSYINKNSVMVFKNGWYYILCDEKQEIWEISVADCTVIKKNLPILRYETLPEDWKNFFDRDETIKFDSFLAIKEYGYASVKGACQFTIRFKLDEPYDYVCMPEASCTATNFFGTVFEVNNVIYSCASECYPNHFYVTKILNNKAITKILFEREKWLYKTSCNSMRSWWKMGDKYILGSIVLDMANNKILVKKMSESWERATNEIIDFVEDDNGNVYLLEYYGDVYALPKSDEFYGQEPSKYLIKYN